MKEYIRPSRSKDRWLWARDLEQGVISIWESARRDGKSHKWITERFSERISEDPRWNKLSNLERERVFVVYHTCSEINYRRDIVWRLGSKDRVFPEATTGNSQWNDELRKIAETSGALYGGHFWKGTDFPFGSYEPIN